MLGDITPRWRPKTRPKKKLRLNIKKLLNPKLNTKAITVLDTCSSDEEIEFSKGDCKRKKALKSEVSSDEKIKSSRGDCKGKKALKSVEQSSLTETKLSAVFLELREEMLKEQ